MEIGTLGAIDNQLTKTHEKSKFNKIKCLNHINKNTHLSHKNFGHPALSIKETSRPQFKIGLVLNWKSSKSNLKIALKASITRHFSNSIMSWLNDLKKVLKQME